LLDEFDSNSPLDEFLRNRAGKSLAHVFTLLSLFLPPEPLRIAFRGLYSEDERLRGTALEYLDGALPPAIRQGILPFLVDGPALRVQPKEEIYANLRRSNPSLTGFDVASRMDTPTTAGFAAV